MNDQKCEKCRTELAENMRIWDLERALDRIAPNHPLLEGLTTSEFAREITRISDEALTKQAEGLQNAIKGEKP